jgi:hypothetical protein
MSRLKQAAFALASVVLSCVAFLVLLEIVLRFLPVCSAFLAAPVTDASPIAHYPAHAEFVHSLGWKMNDVNHGRTNNYGFVNDLDYSRDNSGPLMAVIGDSYIECLMVPYGQTIQGRLSKAAGSRGRVWSFGISGGALPQYLVYAEYAAENFHPAGMIITVVGNDFDESLAKYAKNPRLHTFAERADGRLELVHVNYQPGRLRSIAGHSALIRYLALNAHIVSLDALTHWRQPTYVGNTAADASPERLSDSRRAVDEFLRRLPAGAKLPPDRIVFVVDAIRPQIYTPEELAKARGSFFDRMRNYFLAQAQARGFQAIDLEPVFIRDFARNGRRFEFEDDNHWNGFGHEVAADAVVDSSVFRAVFPGALAGRSAAVPVAGHIAASIRGATDFNENSHEVF